MRKPAFCICENKDPDQLHSYCAVNRHIFFFRYIESQPLYFLNLVQSSVAVQPGLCPSLSETRKTVFLATRLILKALCQMSHVPRKPACARCCLDKITFLVSSYNFPAR